MSIWVGFSSCESRPKETTSATATQSPSAQPLESPVTPASASPAATLDSHHLLARGRAGDVRVGMRIGELRTRFGSDLREVTLQRGGDEFPAFALGRIKNSKLPALLLEPLCEDGEDDATGQPTDHCRIWRITIRDPAYRTAGGLGVGSRYGDIKRAAPLSFVGPNPMGLAATAEDWQMNFLLDTEAFALSKLPAHRETVHDSIRVTGIQLYR